MFQSQPRRVTPPSAGRMSPFSPRHPRSFLVVWISTVATPPPCRLSASPFRPRRYFILSSQTAIHREYRAELERLKEENGEAVLLLDKCSDLSQGASSASAPARKRCYKGHAFDYPHILQVRPHAHTPRADPLLQSIRKAAVQLGGESPLQLRVCVCGARPRLPQLLCTRSPSPSPFMPCLDRQ